MYIYLPTTWLIYIPYMDPMVSLPELFWIRFLNMFSITVAFMIWWTNKNKGLGKPKNSMRLCDTSQFLNFPGSESRKKVASNEEKIHTSQHMRRKKKARSCLIIFILYQKQKQKKQTIIIIIIIISLPKKPSPFSPQKNTYKKYFKIKNHPSSPSQKKWTQEKNNFHAHLFGQKLCHLL